MLQIKTKAQIRYLKRMEKFYVANIGTKTKKKEMPTLMKEK